MKKKSLEWHERKEKMSREIKFRAWLREEKKMVNVETIDFTDKSMQYLEKNEIIDAYLLRRVIFDDIELMQYTGIKDKNGVEIYEGDLVKILDNVNETICEVRFEYGGYILKNGDLREELLYLEERFMEVVGNIYENEELLKSEEKND